MSEVALRGTTLAYDLVGEGEPTFLFIHGWACDRSAWAPQVANLSADYRCLSIDLRGRGQSGPEGPWDIVTAADDVAAVAAELGISHAIVAGHSLGGMVALVLNDRHPDLVTGVVLGDSPVTADFGASTRFPEAILAAGSMEAAAGGFVDSFFRDGTPDDVRQSVREMMLSTPADVAAGMLTLPSDYEFDLPRLLQQADAKPFMAIWAADRPLGNVEWVRDNTIFVRNEPMAGVGHFFQLERPDVTSALLRAFIDDVERDPRLAPSE